jgi:hypothetical protein
VGMNNLTRRAENEYRYRDIVLFCEIHTGLRDLLGSICGDFILD